MAFTFPFYLEVLPGLVEPWKCQAIVVAVPLWHGCSHVHFARTVT